MIKTVRALLSKKGITLISPLSLSACEIVKPYLLERAGISSGTAIMLAVPYYTTKCDDPARNISAYAVGRDYHLFFAELFDEILPELRARFPEHRFAGFTDHSPIAEAHAAVQAGLGFFGCNHLFLTKEHSSFVFLGEIVTDAVIDCPVHPIRECQACGACKRACPVELDISLCRSALTQKKGALTESETKALLAHDLCWGCDICQEACPVTKAAKESGTLYSTIPFFCEQAIPHLSYDLVRDMPDEVFAQRAFSWRGKPTILRNLSLREKGELT